MEFMTKSRRRVIINITSLIDVLFLLLIFFIVSSTFLEQPGMKLDLPEARAVEAQRMEGYTVYITTDDRIFLNEVEVDLEQLGDRLRDAESEIEELILKADENVRYGLVVEVMDLAKQSGIVKLVVATEPKVDQDE
jgi:biopolymer transport protein ExbD